MGQEFESLGAQDEFIRLMQQKGYSYFLRDLGSNDPIRNNSGLCVASKLPLKNIQFIPYPSEDRAGLAKWSNQGALTFTVSAGGKDLRFVNVHLNLICGDEKENQKARNRQLKHHILPLSEGEPTAILGDLNFDTSKVDREASGLLKFTNALEGLVTCTDEGKHTLRGKDRNPGGKPCIECHEKIDGIIYDPNRLKIFNPHVKPLMRDNQRLSDHFALITVVESLE